jgi:hypothetical protein
MKIILPFLLSQSILLPIFIGLIRLRRIDKGYRPFFILLCIGFITEVISFILIQGYKAPNAIPVNIYNFTEWALITWQFHVWGFLRQKKKWFYALVVFGACLWMTENLLFMKIILFSPYFRFFDYLLIVLFSVNKINFMITHDNRNLFRNPKFLICIGFIVYFIYMIVYYWAFEVSLFGQPDISTSITFLMAYVNFFTNIIYAIAFLLIPAPQKFTLD